MRLVKVVLFLLACAVGGALVGHWVGKRWVEEISEAIGLGHVDDEDWWLLHD